MPTSAFCTDGRPVQVHIALKVCDKETMLTHTYTHILLRNITVVICNHQVDGHFTYQLISYLVICKHRIVVHDTERVLTETKSLNNTKQAYSALEVGLQVYRPT